MDCPQAGREIMRLREQSGDTRRAGTASTTLPVLMVRNLHPAAVGGRLRMWVNGGGFAVGVVMRGLGRRVGERARLACRWVVLATLLLPNLLSAGVPPSVRFARDADAVERMFEITRDSRGVVYQASGDGVQSFDGEHWRHIPLAGGQPGRAIQPSGDRLYVGGYNVFGELALQDDGSRQFVDLTAKFASVLDGREFADIWRIVVTPEGVFFCALRDLFLWQPATGEVRHWHHADRFGGMVHAYGDTWLQFRGSGLRRYRDGEWQEAIAHEALHPLVFDFLPVGDGEFLTLGILGDWWLASERGLRPAPMPADMPPSSLFEHSDVLDDGSLALASSDGRLLILPPDRSRFVERQLESGFLAGVIAVPGGVLVSGQQGFHFVTWPAPLSVIGEAQGVVGSINRALVWRDETLILTSAGMVRPLVGEGHSRFQIESNHGDTLHDLLPLDGDRALLAGSHYLLLRDGAALRRVSDEVVYPRAFQPSAKHPRRLYIGTEDGVRVAQHGATGFQTVPRAVGAVARLVDGMVERGDDQIWFGSIQHGLWRDQLDADGALIESRRMDDEVGLPSTVDGNVHVAELPDGRMLVSNAAGVFVDAAPTASLPQLQPFELGDLTAMREADEVLRLVFAGNADAWAYSDRRLLFAPAGGAWRELPARRLRQGAYVAHHLTADGRAMFASEGAVVVHRPQIEAAPIEAPRVQLVSVTLIKSDGERQLLSLDRSQPLQLPHRTHGIEFRFALADITRLGPRSYQGRLLGNEENYSRWDPSSAYTYWSLDPGDYTFELRARDGDGGISEIEPLRLQIASPWYASWTAVLGWIALGVLLLWGLVRVFVTQRTRRLLEQTQRLEATVSERTEALADANRQLLQMANVDGLTGVSNRRRLDDYLRSAHAQCVERQRSLGVLAIDADHFKRYNDTHGHLAGDELLRQLVRQLTRCLRRQEDLLGRFGGEEFLVVLPGATSVIAANLAEAMRAAVEQAKVGVTISVGVAAAIPTPADSADDLIRRADQALYRAKAAGRNTVVLAEGSA